MKVITLLESLSRADGGIFEAELALQRELHLGQGVDVDVVGLEDRYTRQDEARWLPLKPRSLAPRGPEALGYAPGLLRALDSDADLLYAATLWKYPSWAALRWTERTGKPLVVAPHGSLDSWALENSAWKKRIASVLFKNRHLQASSCLRALSAAEAESFRNYGLGNPICIVPNGVNLPDFSGTRARVTGDGKRLLFLGRIHPKKGLANLIRAFAEIRNARGGRGKQGLPWQLVIAGWDQGGHEDELMKLCKELGLSFTRKVHKSPGEQDSSSPSLEASVLFYGPSFGKEKEDLLRSAAAFILPSLSEGLPMAVLEAWASGLPVLMTPECNLPEGFASAAAIRIGTDPESIARGLEILSGMNGEELEAMGDRGRELIRQRFTWKGVARRMKDVYDWLLGGGTPPECIMFR